MKPSILSFELSEVDTESKRESVVGKIVSCKDKDAILIVLLVCDIHFAARAVEEIVGDHNIARFISARDLELLNFCHGIMYSTILTHMMKARGHPAHSVTGFQAGLRVFENREKETEIFVGAGQLERSLDHEKIIIITSMHGITADGEIMAPGERADFLRYIDSIALSDPSSKRRANPAASYGESFLSALNDSVSIKALEKDRVVTGIIVVLNVVEYALRFSPENDSGQLKLYILDSLARQQVSLDMINMCYDSLYFIVTHNMSEHAEALLKRAGVPHQKRERLAKLSIMGVGMKGAPGVMAKIYGALEAAEIDLIRNTDSHITISCLIEEEDLPTALVSLMDTFNLERKDILYENRLV